MADLTGPDVSIEISLKEYGIAWEIGETETRFFYGIAHDGEYTKFESMALENDLDVYEEYSWAEFEDVFQFIGSDSKEWEKMPLTSKIQDLVAYYGIENIFAPIVSNGKTFEEITEEK
jgi:hypothetical protein